MKLCPKCGKEHSKPRIFCSRECANSRVHRPEANAKRSLSLRGKKKTAKAIAQARISFIQTKLNQYLETPFENLGSANRRRRVFEEQNYTCNRCGLAEWQGVSIPLELEHKDGNNKNNTRSNLEGLCPNCHALTPTWRGRKINNSPVL